MSSYRYSSAANADIEEIACYIFDLNPVAAHHFLNALEETCELLAGHSLIGRPLLSGWQLPDLLHCGIARD